MKMPWDAYLGEREREVLARGRFQQRMGFGNRPAVIAIDCQRYMVGERETAGRPAPTGDAATRYPSSCGEIGWQAVDRIAALLASARRHAVPVFLTRFALAPDASDIGVYGRKRTFLDSSDWCIEGTPGAELLPEVGPHPGDTVIVKKKPSAFFGTPLLAYLLDRGIDTVVIVGGATSNCVRATVFDASSFNLRTIVPHDSVFDRLPVSHAISLFDMDRQFADVVTTDEAIGQFERLATTTTGDRR